MNAIKRLWNLCRKNIQHDKTNNIIITTYYKVKINMIAVRADLVQHYIEDHYWDVVSFLMCKQGVGGGAVTSLKSHYNTYEPAWNWTEFVCTSD